MKSWTALVTVISLFGVMTANATTLTFDDLGSQSGLLRRAVGDIYSDQGYQIIASGSGYPQNASFYVFDEGNPLWTGTPGLALFSVGGRIELKRPDAALFNIYSIDIARGDGNSGLIPVGFTGYRPDGTMAMATYWFSDQLRGHNETFLFGADFSGLTSVVWGQGAEWHQFDNIRINAVPEPTTVALVLCGLLGIAATVRSQSRLAET